MYDVGTLEKDFTVFSHDFMKGKKKRSTSDCDTICFKCQKMDKY